jgi:hypothetical protein
VADNTILSAAVGVGDTIASDDVGGVKYQVVKLDVGGDGLAAPVSNTNPVPISDATGSLTVDNGGTFAVQAAQSGNWDIRNVSGTVSLPTGAATLAKQPALGTAGVAATDVITIQGIASMTKLLVTPDSVALPANQSVNVAQVSGTAADTNSGTKSAGTLRVVLATDQPALTNKLLVTPDSVALPANQSVNLSQLAGTTTDTSSGVKSAGTLRVVLATDQPQLTNKLLVTPDANSAVNVAQMNGVAVTMGNGVVGTGVQRVAIASDNTAFSVNAVQSGTWTVQPGNTANSTAWLVQDTAGTTGGSSFNGFVGAASNNKTQIKGSAGTLYLISVQNLAATPVYLKVFNATSANVSAGTTACDFQFMIPGNTAGAGIVLDSAKGIAMGTAITIMLTAGIATTDNTSVSANNQVVLIGYK